MSLGSEEDCLEFIPPSIINPVFDLRDRAVGVPISVTRTLNTSWNYTKAYSLQVWYTYRRLAKDYMSTHCRCVFSPGGTLHGRLVPRLLYVPASVCIYLGFTNRDIYKQPHTNLTTADHFSSITSGVASHWRGFQESTINVSHNACYTHYYDTCVSVWNTNCCVSVWRHRCTNINQWFTVQVFHH